MNWTIGIITDGTCGNRLREIVDSWKRIMPTCQIVICGPAANGSDFMDCDYIPFNEEQGADAICVKKNKITRASSADVIAFTHDYLVPCSDFFEGFERFGYDWDVCMTRIANVDGTRFRDWSLSPEVELPAHRSRERLLPYSYMPDQTKMYVSGAFWVAKRQTMMDYPLNEDLKWGEGEDVEWSERIMPHVKYVMNGHSTMKLLKPKRRSFNPIGVDLLGVIA